jgi:short subunit dehydrogenase
LNIPILLIVAIARQPRLGHFGHLYQKCSEPTIHGKAVVVTGATSGIGKVAAERPAGLDARLILVARDRTLGTAMLAKLNAAAPGISHAVHYAELSRLADVSRVAAEIAGAETKIDVLINNAGAIVVGSSGRHSREAALARERTYCNRIDEPNSDLRLDSEATVPCSMIPKTVADF